MALTPVNLAATNVLSTSVRLTWSGMSYLLRFDGVDDYVKIDNVYTGTATISFWFLNESANSGNHYILSLRENGTGYIVENAGELVVSSGTVYIDGEPTTTLNVGWNYVTVSGINIDWQSGYIGVYYRSVFAIFYGR